MNIIQWIPKWPRIKDDAPVTPTWPDFLVLILSAILFRSHWPPCTLPDSCLRAHSLTVSTVWSSLFPDIHILPSLYVSAWFSLSKMVLLEHLTENNNNLLTVLHIHFTPFAFTLRALLLIYYVYCAKYYIRSTVTDSVLFTVVSSVTRTVLGIYTM